MENTSIYQGWVQFNNGINDYRYEKSSGKLFVMCGDSYIYECTLRAGLKYPNAVQDAYDQAADLAYMQAEQYFF